MNPHEIRFKYRLRHPSTSGILQFLADTHLHPELKAIVRPIRNLAFDLVDSTKDGPELILGLRKLCDAKDAFVRHYLVIHDYHLPALNPKADDKD